MSDSTDPVEKLVQRAKAENVPMVAVCQRARVAASTPSRWRSNVYEPKLRTVRRLETALDEIVAARAG